MSSPRLSDAEKVRRRLARYPEAVRLVDEGRARSQVVEAVECVREGLTWREATRKLGISHSTYYQRLSDPTDKEARARKRKRHGTCEDCGTPTYNGGSHELPRRCRKCEHKRLHREAVERIISAIRDWHRRYGEVPGALDWNVAMARNHAHPARLATILARHEERSWPAAGGVVQTMGWNEAIRAAGFDPVRPGLRRNPELHKAHLRGARKEAAVKAADLIHRELEKNTERQARLKDELAALEDEHEKLAQAAAIFNGGVKADK